MTSFVKLKNVATCLPAQQQCAMCLSLWLSQPGCKFQMCPPCRFSIYSLILVRNSPCIIHLNEANGGQCWNTRHKSLLRIKQYQAKRIISKFHFFNFYNVLFLNILNGFFLTFGNKMNVYKQCKTIFTTKFVRLQFKKSLKFTKIWNVVYGRTYTSSCS